MRYRAAEEKAAAAMKAGAKNTAIDLNMLKARIEERVRAMGMNLEKQVAAGEISESDAKARFEEGEKKMWMRYRAAEEKAAAAKNDGIDLDELKTKIEQRVRAMGVELRKQVASGGISAEDAKARFDEGEKRMWMRYKAAEAKNADAMRTAAKNDGIDLDELKTKIEERVLGMGMNLEKQVAAGEISEADAKARFEEGEKKMWMRYRAAEEKAAAGGKSKADYNAAVEKMTDMVKAGKITREQMQQRLERMKHADD